MNGITWGLLGPDNVASTRRARSLGLGSAVRFFNEQAVPGIGGVWYGKQLWHALLGIAVSNRLLAEGTKIPSIKCANAIEAFACWLAFDSNHWQSDPRLRGATKMRSAKNLSFKVVSNPHFYVTQPMRMTTVNALPALGLVKASAVRFNHFQLSDDCLRRFNLSPKSQQGYGRDIFEHIYQWCLGKRDLHTNRKHKAEMSPHLSPLVPMDESLRRLINDVLHSGAVDEPLTSKQRRRNAIKWVEAIRQKPEQKMSWDSRPSHLDEDHWYDLKAGAMFFALRDQSLVVLDALESHLGSLQDNRSFDLNKSQLPQMVVAEITTLRELAVSYLTLEHPEPMAQEFSRECNADSDTDLVRRLVERDGRVLRLMGSLVLPGPAFENSSIDSSSVEHSLEEEVDLRRLKWPVGISRRMSNLFYLNADLNGDLDTWLSDEINKNSGVSE
jgi:hypothetical protein